MFELLILILFGWLSLKALGLGLRLTWGMAKIVAAILFVVALPTLIGCMMFAGGVILLLPVILAGAACGVLKSAL